MGKKHKHPEHENLERWLVSYADFITLLFATFVVLYALSQADLAKFKTASQSIKDAFEPAKSIMANPGGIMKGNPKSSMLPSSGNSILSKVMPKFPDNAQKEGSSTPNTLEAAVKQINQQIQADQKKLPASQRADKNVELKVQDRGIVISFPSNVFFEAGSAGLKPTAFPLLDKIATQLKKGNPMIHVEGHTDNQPIATAVYPSNWELSSARASSVVRYLLQKQHLQPQRIAAMGYADTRPIAGNTNETDRKKNRRVDIVLLTEEASHDSDAGPAQKNESLVPGAIVSKEADPPPAIQHDLIEKQSAKAKKAKDEVFEQTYDPHAQKPIPIIVKPIDIRPNQPDVLKENHGKDEASNIH